MSKKSRRSSTKRRQVSRKSAEKVLVRPDQALRPTSEGKAAVFSADRSSSSTQATRYHYVLPELRRIGIIGCCLFVVLIILTFILG